MAAVTAVQTLLTEFSGDNKVVLLTATIVSASDTVTLTQAANGISTIQDIVAHNIKSGLGANFATLQVTFSGLVITIVSKNAAGAASTTWGDVRISVIGY